MTELVAPPEILRQQFYRCVTEYPLTLDTEDCRTNQSTALARQATDLFEALPKGPLYSAEFYQHDDSLLYRANRAGRLVLRLPEQIGDTLMLRPAIQFAADLLHSGQQTNGCRPELIVRTKHPMLLEGIAHIQTGPLKTREKDDPDVLIDLGGRKYLFGDYACSISWIYPYTVAPINAYDVDKEWSGPAIGLRFMEYLLGYKTEPVNYMGVYQFPEASSLSNEVKQPENPYIVTANTAAIGPRRWPDEQYVDMMRLLQRKKPELEIVYIADPGRSDKRTVQLLKNIPHVTVFSGNLSAVMNLVRNAKAGLFTDSGIGHISALFVPTLRCFSCANPHFWSVPGNPNDFYMKNALAEELQSKGIPYDLYPFRFRVGSFNYPQIVGGRKSDVGLFELDPNTVIGRFIQIIDEAR